MSLTINLLKLREEEKDLQGELSIKELELEGIDDFVRVAEPVRYDLHAQYLEQAVLVQGSLETTLDCECVRCLRRFRKPLEVEDWAAHLPLEGEDQVPIQNDLVDLTPFLREDILLLFPQHPLCKPECSGLKSSSSVKNQKTKPGPAPETSTAWEELNKLKL